MERRGRKGGVGEKEGGREKGGREEERKRYQETFVMDIHVHVVQSHKHAFTYMYLNFLFSAWSSTANTCTVPLSLETQRKEESRLKLMLGRQITGREGNKIEGNRKGRRDIHSLKIQSTGVFYCTVGCSKFALPPKIISYFGCYLV